MIKYLLNIPYPYKAMISISNDCDGLTLEWFDLLHRFMNTNEETVLGRGLGLDISDSMWIYAPDHSDKLLRDRVLSMKTGLSVDSPEDMAGILSYHVGSGWIDTLHSIGDFSGIASQDQQPTSAHVDESERIMEKYNCQVPIWVNHGNSNNIQNIGTHEYMKGGRDDSNLFLLPHIRRMGIQYINNRFDNGQSFCLPKITNYDKDGNNFYSFSRFHKKRITKESNVEGIQKITQTKRGAKIGFVWHPTSLQHQINRSTLDLLMKNNCEAIIAQHLGSGPKNGFPDSAIKSLQILKEYQDNKNVLVARTSRLLNFVKIRDRSTIYTEVSGRDTIIFVIGPDDQKNSLDDFRGLSFILEEQVGQVKLIINDKECPPELIFRERRNDGCWIVGISWHKSDNTDYSGGRIPRYFME